MRKAKVLFKDEEAGVLTQHDDGTFSFKYHAIWVADSNKRSICLTLPKREREFKSKHLFAFFYNLLPEGTNKQLVCNTYRIDKDDYFGLLMVACKLDSIGAVRVIKEEN